mgnify:CR=1 FL=1
MTNKVEDQFTILLNSLNSSLIQKDLPKDTIDESLHVWQPVPFASKEIEVAKTLLKELPSIGTQTFSDVVESVPPSTVVSTAIETPAVLVPTVISVPTTVSPSITPPVQPLTSLLPPIQAQPLPQMQPEYMYPYMYPHSYVHPPSMAPSYPISYAPPSYAPSYLEPIPETKDIVVFKEKVNENKFYLWALYIFGFSLILLIVFGLLWFFYIKDYNKYKLTKNEDKLEDSFDDKSTLLQPPSTLQKELELDSKPPLKQLPTPKEFNAFELESLIKEEEEEEEEEFFESDKIFESLNALESLTIEKPPEPESIPVKLIDKIPEKKEKLKKNYFDLSDMDSTDFVSPPPIEKKISSGGKLTDESPEVNDYAKKRELALQ